MSESEFIHVVTEANFDHEVIQRSKEVPVLVDFWADWCNPCKTLMPILAKLAKEYQGAFHLAKINTEEQRELAAQNGIRSLPTVRVFRHGEVVDEFNGALPEGAVREFIERHLPKEEDGLLQQALELIAENNTAEAIPLLVQARELNQQNKKVLMTLADAYMQIRQYDELTSLLENLPITLNEDSDIQTYVARLRFINILRGAPTTEELKQRIASDKKDAEAHYQLGAYHVSNGEWEPALDSFLKVISLDRTFGDDAGRKAVLDVFNILGGSGPIVTLYRTKMASLLH